LFYARENQPAEQRQGRSCGDQRVTPHAVTDGDRPGFEHIGWAPAENAAIAAR
jgi:hypothetical protein